MSEYSELIKNFSRIRDYMREFFVFGFKTRNDFNQKSKRTYDNERRRIENYLGDLTKWEYGDGGKKVFISVDSSKIPVNPFYKAYKSKSFTDNDVILHFLILDILTSNESLTLDEITDLINNRVEFLFEPQTVRNKLKEYTEYGIITATKEKKAHYYSLNKCYFEDFDIPNDAINFFSEVAPFGVVGSYINDRIDNKNKKFQYKHNFIVNTLSVDEIRNIINENSFAESCFHLLPKLETLPFIEKRDGKYYSLLENKIKMPITNIEKSWLKAISQDPRFELFAVDYDKSKLDDIEPLYEQEQFKYYDKYSDGDDFDNYYYQKHFRKINAALENSTPVKIVYQNPKGRITVNHYIPVKFEFSPKDDKFRFFAARIRNGKLIDYVCLNMGRILDVRNSNETYKGKLNLEPHLKKFDCEEPVVVEVYNDRNAIERFMVEFSTYRKNSEFDDNTQTCTTKIYYRKTDEIEVLIKLLSFGPTLKVLGPERFLKLFKYRIKK